MRVLVFLLLVTAGAAEAEAPDTPTPTPGWEIPPSEEIRGVITPRVSIRGAGMVIGIIEPAGRRVVVCGQGRAANGRALDGDTIFMIGSVTKTFTTLLLADAVRRGEVGLDDPARRYLRRGVTLRERGRPISLRDLATHVSGLPSMPSNFDLHAEPDPISAYTPRDLDRFLESHVPARAPGEKWEYSNLGVALLGRLLARRAGQDYESLLHERVLAPLGLRNTAITLTREQSSRVAPGLDRYGEPAINWEMRTLQASGSLRSSANDLLEYLAAILGYRDAPLRAAIDQQLAERSSTRDTQALGWGLGRFEGREIFVHDGGKAGYRSLLAFDRTRKRGIVLLVNARTDDRLGGIALWLIDGRPLPPAPPALAPRSRVLVDPRTLASYQGRYRFENGRELVLASQRNRLIMGSDADGPQLLVAANDREFYDPSGVEELEFAQSGKADAVTLYERGRQQGGGIAGRRISAAR